MPRTFNEVGRLATQMKRIFDSSCLTYDDESVSVKKVSQKKIRNNAKNLFLLVSASDFKVMNLWRKIENKGSENLIKIHQFIEKIGGEICRGIETRTSIRVPLKSAFVLRELYNVKKGNDAWIVGKNEETVVYCRNLHTDQTIAIPKSSLTHGLRRFSGLDVMDVSLKLDLVLVEPFNGIEVFLGIDSEDLNATEIKLWQKYVENRLTNLAFVRRFGLSRPGTRLLAYFSSLPAAPTGIMWSIKGISSNDAKILTVWFNSSVNILQLLLNRIETSAAWMELHKYALNDLCVLNPLALSRTQKIKLVDLFEKIKSESFPSIYNQIKYGFWAREEIDRAILSYLGFTNVDAKRLSKTMKFVLSRELTNLEIRKNYNSWNNLKCLESA